MSASRQQPVGQSAFATLAVLILLLATVLPSRASNPAPSGTAAEPTPLQPIALEAVRKAQIMKSFGNLPLSFEANRGQADHEVKFLSEGSGYGLYFTGREAILTLEKPQARGRRAGASSLSRITDVVRMQLAGARREAAPVGVDPLPGTANYFLGHDPAQWHTGIPTFAKVRYASVYPGVDLVYYGNQQQLEYDFVVAPGASVQPIRLHFAGATQVGIDNQGNLTVAAHHGSIAFHKPEVYQLVEGRRQSVEGRFQLMADNTAGFVIGRYDSTQPLVIDPTLVYSTYLSASASSYATSIAVDAFGCLYMTGATTAYGIPVTSGAFKTTSSSSNLVAFVSKFNAQGTALVYSTFLGGSVKDTAVKIAVDAAGEAYVAGQTNSSDFPVTKGAFQTTKKSSASNTITGFVSKLNASGSALLYSTYLGGSNVDQMTDLALDPSGNAYVSGMTFSTDFPTSSGAFQSTNNAATVGGWNAFVSKLGVNGSSLSYSTYLGGSLEPTGTLCNTPISTVNHSNCRVAIAVDASGYAYVGGLAFSSDFPVTQGALQTVERFGDGGGLTLTKLNSTGSGLVYSTWLGVGDDNAALGFATGLAVDGSGNAYLTAYGALLPVTPGAFQPLDLDVLAGGIPGNTGMALKLNPTGTALIYATYLGGSANNLFNDYPYGMAVDSRGDLFISGLAYSTDFSVTSDAYQSTNKGVANGAYNAYLTELSPDGSREIYSTFLGGTGVAGNTRGTPTGLGDAAMAVALGSAGDVYLAGWTYSKDFPVTSGAFQTTDTSTTSAFVTKMNFGTTTTTTLTSSANPQTTGDPVTFTAAVQANSGSAIPTGSVVFSVDGTPTSTVALDSTGHATYATSSLSIGTHTVEADYAGTALFAVSSSSILNETINPPVADSPAFSPAQGTYPTTQTVFISDATAQATIHFTTDGSTPTTASPVYTAPISVSATETLAAMAVATGYTPSGVSTATYTIQTPAAAPTFAPPPAIYTTPQPVSILDTTPGATIYYTTDGSLPTTSSYVYTGPIMVSSSETLQAMAKSSNSTPSTVSVGSYTIALLAASQPTISPAPGTYPAAQSITMTDSTPGALIYYTTNGTTPTTASTRYTTAIPVTTSQTIQAIALANGYTQSTVATAGYTILTPAATPTFTPAAGTYNAAQTVSIGDTTPGATIYYTLDGSTPTTASTKYTGAITVSSTETIEAMAVATGYSQSAVATAAYTITASASVPSFSLAGGTYSSAQTVSLSDSTTGATIYYTTNGSTPTTSSTKYTGPITVSSTETIEAMAFATGYSQSAVATAAYTIQIATNPVPVLGNTSPAFTSAGGSTFTLTVNGSGFITNSTVYWGSSSLVTQYVSATRLTAQVPSAQIVSVGAVAISVQSPTPGGGTSNVWQFEVDSASLTSATEPTISSPSASTAVGSIASYLVTVPGTATNVMATCLNLPAGATCSYSSATNTLTIATASSTPSGTYQITVVFTETLPGVATAGLLLPFLLLPEWFLQKKLAARGMWLTTCAGVLFLAAAALTIGCGAGTQQPTSPVTATYQATSASSVSLLVK